MSCRRKNHANRAVRAPDQFRRSSRWCKICYLENGQRWSGVDFKAFGHPQAKEKVQVHLKHILLQAHEKRHKLDQRLRSTSRLIKLILELPAKHGSQGIFLGGLQRVLKVFQTRGRSRCEGRRHLTRTAGRPGSRCIGRERCGESRWPHLEYLRIPAVVRSTRMARRSIRSSWLHGSAGSRRPPLQFFFMPSLMREVKIL